MTRTYELPLIDWIDSRWTSTRNTIMSDYRPSFIENWKQFALQNQYQYKKHLEKMKNDPEYKNIFRARQRKNSRMQYAKIKDDPGYIKKRCQYLKNRWIKIKNDPILLKEHNERSAQYIKNKRKTKEGKEYLNKKQRERDRFRRENDPDYLESRRKSSREYERRRRQKIKDINNK